MRWASWIRNGKRSLERRWARHQALRKPAAHRRAVRPRLEVLEDRWLLSPYVVTSTSDDGSTGTLRDAIFQANVAGSTITEIDFNIGTSGSAQTINLTSQLPALKASGVFINGLSQGDTGNTKQLITLNGSGVGSSGAGIITDGLLLQGSNDIVSGLIIQGFSGPGGYVNALDVAGSNDTIGGTAPGAGNIISGNTSVALNITSSGVLAEGNYIGTNAAGSAAMANGDGIEVNGSNNTIGGTTSGARNIISGNRYSGVYIAPGVSGVLVEGNYIGTDVTGASAMGNGYGVSVEGPGNTIGGTTSGAGNVISGNTNYGVFVQSNAPGDAVEGNYIGTNAAGSEALANSVGIEVASSNDTIGGTTSGARNVISGNSADGVLIDSTASGVAVQGNFIGTDVTGTHSLSNNLGIEEVGSNNSIGGSVASAGNLIADNSQGGVLVNTGWYGVTGGGRVNTGTGDPIRSNSIYANGSTGTGPGITLSNGGNNALAAPSLNSATLNGSSLTVTGSFNSPSANNTYVLEFFANPSSDAEGKVYLGSLTVTSTNTTLQSFTFTTTTTVTGTYPLITATLTDPSGDTSAFSNGVSASAAQYAPTVTTNPASQTVTADQNASFTAYANGNPTPKVQWQVSTDGGKTFTDISGATSTTLTLNDVQAAQNGDEYQAVFSNSVGTATTAAATLTLQYAPTVTTNPNTQTVTAGQTAIFAAVASGNPTATVQWQVSADGGKTFTNITGATSATLTLNNVTTAMSGYEYEAVFTNSAGSATTSAATLTVNATVAPIITSNPSNQTVMAGQSATFSVSAGGSPTPTVQWQVSSDGGKTFTNLSGATNVTLTLNHVTIVISGNEYQAVFTNRAGTVATSAATLIVNPAPPLPPPPPSPLSPTTPPVLNVPPMLAFLDSLLGGIETVNGNGTETITDSFLGIPLIVAAFDSHGNLMSVDLFGFVNITFLFV